MTNPYTSLKIQTIRGTLDRRLANAKHQQGEQRRLGLDEKYSCQAGFVIGLETAKQLFDTLGQETAVDVQDLGLVETAIRRMMEQLDATQIAIALAKNDRVEIAFCGDLGIDEEAEGDTLEEAFAEAGCLNSFTEQAF